MTWARRPSILAFLGLSTPLLFLLVYLQSHDWLSDHLKDHAQDYKYVTVTDEQDNNARTEELATINLTTYAPHRLDVLLSNSSELTMIKTGLLYGDVKSAPAQFQPALTTSESLLLNDMLAVFHREMQKANITYFMCGGTLLGSWRHHGRIPWDNDVDLYIRATDRPRLMSLASHVGPHYKMSTAGPRWKLYSKHGAKIREGLTWNFPFIDLCFVDENSDNLWDIDPGFHDTFAYPKHWIFPLRLRPFNGMMLWAPNKTHKVVEKNYQLDNCFSGSWNHKAEKNILQQSRSTVSCSKLKKAYPFVVRSADTTLETLQLSGQNITAFGWVE